MRYAVIMAGGSGQRLWPFSRKLRPKQLLPLVEGKSLLEIAVERIEGMFESENIFVITNSDYAQKVVEALPRIPSENIIGEPQGRDTANAVALAAAVIQGKDPDATIATFTADHIIRPEDCFLRAVNRAMEAAEANPDALLTFGVRPTWPHTGLGYIEVGEKIEDGLFKVASFCEKPDHPTARKYVESGRYYWNSGMFVWKVGAIQSALEKYLPDSLEKLRAVTKAVETGADMSEPMYKIYGQLQKISIDYAIMEKAQNVMMTELNCEWIDLGSWPALEDVIEPDDKGNTIQAKNHVIIDSFHNIIVSEGKHMIAVMGMDDCIIVHSEDATLVCRRSDNQRLKEMVDAIGTDFEGKFL